MRVLGSQVSVSRHHSFHDDWTEWGPVEVEQQKGGAVGMGEKLDKESKQIKGEIHYL